jgi:hypothetical protein
LRAAVRVSRGASQRHANARLKLADAERLGQIVVSTGVEGLDLLLLVAAR